MTLIMQFLDYLFSHEDLEDLEDFNLPKDALQLAKMARFGRDRDGRNVLSILLDWKNVKAFVKGTTLVCVVRMVIDSMLPHAESGPNDHRKDAPPFIGGVKETNF